MVATDHRRAALAVGILILFVLAALLFRWQGDRWTVVAGKLLAVLVLYVVAIYLVFGVGLPGCPEPMSATGVGIAAVVAANRRRVISARRTDSS